MRERMTAALAILVLAAPLPCARHVEAQATSGAPTATTATRPEKKPASQTSVPSAAPPATTKQTTGSTNQPSTVKTMNEDANAKANKEGK